MASGKVYKKLPYYQVSFFTLGTEQDLVVIEQVLQNAGIPYSDFTGIQGDENDDTVTNYYTYVRCVENAK
ncbi:hypothetical protein CU000_2110 [Enterococcus faecium]|nr:hypothetical protein [Enterococcus faecium]